MSDHTPEPWDFSAMAHLSHDDTYAPQAIRRTGNRNAPHISEVRTGKADARRIVACVNACAGLSTDALENGIIEDMVSVMTQHVEAHKHTADEFMNGKTLEDMGIQTYTGEMERILNRLDGGEA